MDLQYYGFLDPDPMDLQHYVFLDPDPMDLQHYSFLNPDPKTYVDPRIQIQITKNYLKKLFFVLKTRISTVEKWEIIKISLTLKGLASVKIKKSQKK